MVSTTLPNLFEANLCGSLRFYIASKGIHLARATRLLSIAAIAASVALALTGCTPPMPPEVRAALAEQDYVCVSGDATVSFPRAITDLASGFQDSVASACADMTLTPATDAASAQIVIDATGQNRTGAYVSVPFALDATVIAVNIAGISSINLTAANIQDILTGKITDWSDAAIAKANPGVELTAEPILLDARIQRNGHDVLVSWLTRLNNGKFDAGKLQVVDELTVDDALLLPEGGLAFLPYSVNSEALWVTAGIVTDANNPNDSAVIPDSDHINSAGSQLRVVKGEKSITTKLKVDAKPLAPAGQDQAVLPYQAVYNVPLELLGADNLVARGVARFLLRQDSQGMLGASYLLPIPETVRVEVLDLISVGLPEQPLPTDVPAN